MIAALVESMTVNGYAGTSVAEVTRRAGVSRETFYQQFPSKENCFSAALDAAIDKLLEAVVAAPQLGGAAHQRCAQLVAAYLDAVTEQPALARMFLVEVYAAGPAAVRRRAESQQRFVEVLTSIIGDGSVPGHFACEVLVAALSAMVTNHLVTGDMAGLQALQEPFAHLIAQAVGSSGRR